MENGQSTAAKLGLPPLTPEQQEALQKVSKLDVNLLLSTLVWLGFFGLLFVGFFASVGSKICSSYFVTEFWEQAAIH